MSVKEAKHLPIQHNVVAVAYLQVCLPLEMQSEHRYIFSMCNYLDDPVTGFISHVAESCQWIEESSQGVLRSKVLTNQLPSDNQIWNLYKIWFLFNSFGGAVLCFSISLLNTSLISQT